MYEGQKESLVESARDAVSGFVGIAKALARVADEFKRYNDTRESGGMNDLLKYLPGWWTCAACGRDVMDCYAPYFYDEKNRPICGCEGKVKDNETT